VVLRARTPKAWLIIVVLRVQLLVFSFRKLSETCSRWMRVVLRGIKVSIVYFSLLIAFPVSLQHKKLKGHQESL
jgi:hypothetical protein